MFVHAVMLSCIMYWDGGFGIISELVQTNGCCAGTRIAQSATAWSEEHACSAQPFPVPCLQLVALLGRLDYGCQAVLWLLLTAAAAAPPAPSSTQMWDCSASADMRVTCGG